MKKEQALNILETFLTDEQLERLIRVSDMTGAPISTLIRIAVADYLKNLPKSFYQLISHRPVELEPTRSKPTGT
jgi:hypothetical protein